MGKIYGFGNALMDIEIRISEEELREIDIPKNTMKHISHDELSEYLEKYDKKISTINPGGSIANTIFAAADNGAKTFFSFVIGDDEYGELFTKSFRDKESISFKKTEYRTGVCLIFVTPDGNRTMAANLGANTQLNSDCLDFEHMQDAEFLVFDNFTLSALSNFNNLKFLYECPAETKICFGVSDVSLVDENLDLLNQLSQLKLFLIYGNAAEIRALQNKLQFDTENILESEGENGAIFNQLKVNAPDIIAVNTNGAGDALVGSFLAKYSKLSTELCLKQAVEYASKVCCVRGPRLT